MTVDVIIGFGFGVLVGAVLGIMIFALCAIQSDREEHHDR